MALPNAREKAVEILDGVASDTEEGILVRTGVDTSFKDDLLAKLRDTLTTGVLMVTSPIFAADALAVARMTAFLADSLSHIAEQTAFCVTYVPPPGTPPVPGAGPSIIPAAIWKAGPMTVGIVVAPPAGSKLSDLHIDIQTVILRAGVPLAAGPATPRISFIAGGVIINALPPRGVAGDIIIFNVTVEKWGFFKNTPVESSFHVFQLGPGC